MILLKIFICGINGVLGSNLARTFLEEGFDITGNDITRIDEAWKLEGIKDQINYLWKSSIDLKPEDIDGSDILFDCALEFADRPMGISSPIHTVLGNLLPPISVLESIRRLKKKPVAIYPSSFNVFYGLKPQTLKESTPPITSSVYGWSKMAAEQLYYCYCKAYEIPIIITRVGSAYGPKMRSDELVARLIIYCLKNKDFYMRSPEAKRLWCFGEDVIDFYKKLVEKGPENFVGEILHCSSNKGDEIVTNLELADKIKRITRSNIKIINGEYEPGETVDGKPIDFTVDSTYSKVRVGWEPKHALNEGLVKTVSWFKENLWRYK